MKTAGKRLELEKIEFWAPQSEEARRIARKVVTYFDGYVFMIQKVRNRSRLDGGEGIKFEHLFNHF